MDEHSSELLRRWQAGDQEAAEALFRRRYSRYHHFVFAPTVVFPVVAVFRS